MRACLIVIGMREIINTTDYEEIKKYIEDKEGVRLKLKQYNKNQNNDKKGLRAHYDNDNPAMPNNKYTASILKTKEHEGGELVFLDGNDNELQVIGKEEHFNKAVIMSVDQRHMVKPTLSGERYVDVYFWELENES